MSPAAEKTVQTLGEVLAAQARRLSRRRWRAVSWLDLLQPVIERNASRAQGGGRFERREAVSGAPRRSPALTPGDPTPAGEEVTDGGEPVPAGVRDQLRPVLGPGVDLARVHADARSDAFARAQQADAVTVGPDVYFRSGSFAPQSPRGLGLLAHELSHVTDGGRPDAEQARARPEGARQEEERARAVEQRFARPSVSPLAAQAYAAPARPPAAAPAAAASGMESSRPMRAAADRPAADPAPSAATAAPNFDRLRQSLLRDIMSQIRVEFERGS
jgi:Domain of unknown function (DUF4157)